jgi:hypothetical protein
MGSTGDPSGESSLAPCGPVTSSRKRGAGRKGAPATQQDTCPALSDLYNPQYRSLFRLAVLLTGDADAAEAVVLDSSCRVVPPAEAPADRGRRLAAPAATAGWPGHGWPGITISRTAAGGPGAGAGPPAAPALRTRHRGPNAQP